ncbi:unnamed protein product, partial [Mesorhabditis belari]|uniref:Lipase n=1 Tax=Mesorhabditis belari TaxID=2138241 RepID=A0AAF3EMT9_9BILA
MKFLFLGVLCLCGASAQIFASSDPEISMTTPQIIQRWGYAVEVHTITTIDGYMIDLHRIPNGKNGVRTANKPVVLMQHGLMADSSVWVSNLPQQSAAFLFADAGFDVWLGNLRGNTYGMRHKTLSPQNPAFWKFSFDDAASTLPAFVNYILQMTNQQSLNYIGHSQGALMMFARLSEDPTFAQKIANHFALAPLGTMNNVKGPLFTMAKTLGNLTQDQLFSLFGAGQLIPRSDLVNQLKTQVCQSGPVCDNFLFLTSGSPSASQFNISRLPIYLSHTPSPSSTQNFIHYLQNINAQGVVPKYDFGNAQLNIAKYGQPSPPLYDFSKINAPTHLFWGDLDVFADKIDIENWLLPILNKQWLRNNIELPNFAHMDFVWGLNAANQVYMPIINFLRGAQRQQPIMG